jgi:hypothetical protein
VAQRGVDGVEGVKKMLKIYVQVIALTVISVGYAVAMMFAITAM